MLPINRPVRIVTRDGKTIRGRRLNEDTFTVQIIDEQERLLSIAEERAARLRGRDEVADAGVRRSADARTRSPTWSRICSR